ncbi:hypothetical protein HYW21_03380 [Candidatus Woesearchaeota archaeon]|nr:hypothetical protein [Candidatus Woesearchaeota archaeon]
MRPRENRQLRWQYTRKASVEFPTWMVVSLVLSAIFILVLFGFAQDLYASVIKRPDESVTSFTTLTAEVQDLLEDKKDFAAVEQFLFTLDDPYFVIGFDTTWEPKSEFGTGAIANCGNVHLDVIQKPSLCKGSACLCVFQSWDKPQCTLFAGDITFMRPRSVDMAVAVGEFEAEKQRRTRSDSHTIVTMYPPETEPQGIRYGYLVYGDCETWKTSAMYLEKYVKADKTYVFIAEKPFLVDQDQEFDPQQRYEQLRQLVPPLCSDYSAEQCKQLKPGTEVSVEATTIIDGRACSTRKANCVYQPNDACALACIWPSCPANEPISTPCTCNANLIEKGYCCLNKETSTYNVEARPCHCKEVSRCQDYTDSEGLDCTHDTCYIAPLTGCIWDISTSRCKEKAPLD